ncbi:MAG: caspase family protein [Synechococcales bacterium]|nr:caspase family protein [Synechococcales bacterium]
MANPVPNIYALLIGIDYYKPNQLYKSLKGAVRDINLVYTFLKDTLKLPEERIYKLTSSNPQDTALLEARAAQGREPTYQNIVNTFKEITEKAQPQEQVYIHYAGHGGRATTLYSELKGEGQNDEGLVPMDIGEQNGQYLRDVELATLLKRMTDKGLVVTVVLDSCHSGGATRGDCDIRGSNEVDTATRGQESLVASREELMSNWRSLTEDTNRTSWVPESREYVLLAACRPTEFAFEYAVNGKDRHGALTYWMIDTLSTIPGTLTYKTLYDRIGAKIQSKFPSQLPMLLGEGDRSVLGSDIVSTQYTVIVTSVNASQKQVKLNAGLASGLGNGTRFAIYPLNTPATDFTDRQKQLAIVEVTEVEASSAYAKILAEAEGGIDVKDEIEQGAPAVLLSAPADLVRRVRLFDQKQLGDGDNELPTQELVDAQKQALAAVRQALTENGWVTEVEEGEEGHYQVAVGRNGEYEICIGLPLENLNPPLQTGHPDSPKEVVKRLVHLAKYQSVQELDNPASELADALEFVLLDQNKQPFPNQSNITLQQGSKVYLHLKNVSPQALNVAVLDLEPTWEISQIPLRGIDAPFYQLVPQETVETPLRFKVPEGEGYRQAKEMLKLFATRGPADFRWLKLPSLDQEIKRSFEATRGLRSAFGKLLEAVGEEPGMAPSLTRAAIYEPDPNAEWVTQQIQITIQQ